MINVWSRSGEAVAPAMSSLTSDILGVALGLGGPVWGAAGAAVGAAVAVGASVGATVAVGGGVGAVDEVVFHL